MSQQQSCSSNNTVFFLKALPHPSEVLRPGCTVRPSILLEAPLQTQCFLGRRESSQIADPVISRRVCRIVMSNTGRLYLDHVKTIVWVNGVPIQQQQEGQEQPPRVLLSHGDIIGLPPRGGYRYQVLFGNPASTVARTKQKLETRVAAEAAAAADDDDDDMNGVSISINDFQANIVSAPQQKRKRSSEEKPPPLLESSGSCSSGSMDDSSSLSSSPRAQTAPGTKRGTAISPSQSSVSCSSSDGGVGSAVDDATKTILDGSTEPTATSLTRQPKENPTVTIPPTVLEECFCALCLDLQVQATILVPCGHSFCRGCLEDCAEKQDYQTNVVNECPTCREPVQQHIPNRSLTHVIDNLTQLSSSKEASATNDNDEQDYYNLQAFPPDDVSEYQNRVRIAQEKAATKKQQKQQSVNRRRTNSRGARRGAPRVPPPAAARPAASTSARFRLNRRVARLQFPSAAARGPTAAAAAAAVASRPTNATIQTPFRSVSRRSSASDLIARVEAPGPLPMARIRRVVASSTSTAGSSTARRSSPQVLVNTRRPFVARATTTSSSSSTSTARRSSSSPVPSQQQQPRILRRTMERDERASRGRTSSSELVLLPRKRQRRV